MKQKLMNLVLVLMVGVTMIFARPVFAADEPTLDLSIDRNGNQISDAIESEVATLRALPADQQTTEIKNFVAKLPLSADTLALQKRAQELSMSLSTAKPEDAQVILDELAKISSQLDEDPVIKKATSDLLTVTGIGLKDGTTPSLFVAFSSLRKGDILGRRSWYGGLFPWAMKYEHLGNYNGNDYVYESNPDGVTLKPLSKWKSWGQYVGLAHDKRVTDTTIANAVEWAKTTYGTNGRTPYNWNFADKQTNASLYCSQLTWKIHSYAGFNLDSNDSYYLFAMSIRFGPWIIPVLISAVAPDEVMLSPHLTVYSEGWN